MPANQRRSPTRRVNIVYGIAERQDGYQYSSDSFCSIFGNRFRLMAMAMTVKVPLKGNVSSGADFD